MPGTSSVFLTLLIVSVPLILLVIVFHVMAYEAYRAYIRLGGRKGGLTLAEAQFLWIAHPPRSEEPRREAVRQQFLRHRKRMIGTMLVVLLVFGVGFYALTVSEGETQGR